MKRDSIWSLILVFAVAACGGQAADDAAADGAMEGEMEGEAMTADAAFSCTVMGDMGERASPLQEMAFTYDGGEGLLCYGAPSANGREIMGGLVPFGEVWRLGANEPTTIHLSAPVSISGVALDAGSYSVYAIPGESEWEFFFNTNVDRWGIPIDDEVRSTEVGSFTVTAGQIDRMVEMMTFSPMDNALHFEWESTAIHIPMSSDMGGEDG